MSKPNQYGYSSQMNPKLKSIVLNYSPTDKSEITALRNKKSLWHLNSIHKVELRNVSDPLSDKEQINVCLVIITVIILLWTLFNV